jgi:hypothetical protein
VVPVAEKREVGGHVPRSDAEHEAPARGPVQHDGVLGESHRVVERSGEHQRAHPDPPRPGADPCGHEQRRHQAAPANLVELREEEGVEPRILGGADLDPELVDQGGQIDALPLNGKDDPEAALAPAAQRTSSRALATGSCDAPYMSSISETNPRSMT